MQTATIRISAPAHSLLREMARQEKKPMQAIIDQALEAYRRQSESGQALGPAPTRRIDL